MEVDACTICYKTLKGQNYVYIQNQFILNFRAGSSEILAILFMRQAPIWNKNGVNISMKHST